MLVLLLLTVPVIALLARLLTDWRRRRLYGSDTVVVGFFHPYCNAGGGGERVLWAAVDALLRRHETSASPRAQPNQKLRIVVYTGDTDTTGADILARTRERFNIALPADAVDFVFLRQRSWVEAKRYPYFTLLGQSVGSMVLGLEAFVRFVPDVYIDSMGYAFTFPIFKLLGGCRVACYVHYPTISSDMLQVVSQREAAYNNVGAISRSRLLSGAKVVYYRLFAQLYGWMGWFADAVMVNSSWTRNHIRDIWKVPASRLSIVFPPCNTDALRQIPLDNTRRKPYIVSVAQFRPEKNHRLQLEALAEVFRRDSALRQQGVQLILIGGCRHVEDTERQQALASYAVELGIEKHVRFELNAPFETLHRFLAEGTIGLHTMWNEHFGIGIVEYMAAGLIPVAHRSGGPLADIIVPFGGAEQPVGYLAETKSEYADALLRIFALNNGDRTRIQTAARAASAHKFADSQFAQGFLDSLLKNQLLNL